MELDQAQTRKLAVGTLVGALLGAGVAWLLMKAPANLEEGETPNPISTAEVIGLTSAAAILVRKLDDFRRKM